MIFAALLITPLLVSLGIISSVVWAAGKSDHEWVIAGFSMGATFLFLNLGIVSNAWIREMLGIL